MYQQRAHEFLFSRPTVPRWVYKLKVVACLGEISDSVLKHHHSPLCQLTRSHKYQLKISVQNGHKLTRVLSLSLCLSSPRPFHPKTSPASRNPKLSKWNCANAQNSKSEWCSSSSPRTCLRKTPVPLSIRTWLEDLVAPHFPASTALDPPSARTPKNPLEGIPDSQLWT